MNKLIHNTDSVPLFGHYLIRDVLLKDLLGDKQDSILYWAGKNIARKYPLSKMDEIEDFFARCGWGNLIIKKEGKSEMSLELQSIFQPHGIEPSYQLEAGFLAEQIQNQKGFITEACVTIKKKSIIFSIQWDSKDKI